MRYPQNRYILAAALAGAGAAWPSLVCAISDALMTPLQRAMQASWCGAGAAPEALGHCAVCWTGAALLFAVAVAPLLSRPEVRPGAA